MRENGRSEINQFHFTRKLPRQSSILENGMYHISKEEVKQCSNEEPFRFLQCSFVQLRHSPFTFPVVKEKFSHHEELASTPLFHPLHFGGQ